MKVRKRRHRWRLGTFQNCSWNFFIWKLQTAFSRFLHLIKHEFLVHFASWLRSCSSKVSSEVFFTSPLQADCDCKGETGMTVDSTMGEPKTFHCVCHLIAEAIELYHEIALDCYAIGSLNMRRARLGHKSCRTPLDGVVLLLRISTSAQINCASFDLVSTSKPPSPPLQFLMCRRRFTEQISLARCHSLNVVVRMRR